MVRLRSSAAPSTTARTNRAHASVEPWRPTERNDLELSDRTAIHGSRRLEERDIDADTPPNDNTPVFQARYPSVVSTEGRMPERDTPVLQAREPCRAIACFPSRRLDRGPKARVERPSLKDKPLIVDRRSLVYGG